ncbi:MAG: C1 family peptidase, partial [Kiritimatiellae bacterium]|nr:C1 family peptidase [Kiritimatiellia bacterium]
METIWAPVFIRSAGVLLLVCAGVASAGPVPFEEDDTIEEIREKIALNGYAFEVATNAVFNLPRAERKALHNRRASEPSNYRMAVPEDAGPLEEVLKERKALPASFDWRDVGGRAYIGGVRDQGSCGSCYAFGACAAAESTYNYAMGLYDGSAVDFSESFIIWCLGTLPDYNEHFYGCDGADYDYAELTAMTREGISYESAFPYTVSGSCGTHWNDPRVVFDSWHRIPCGDIEAIKTAIMTYGAVDVAVYVGSAFDAYSSGIYEDTRTACNGSPCYYTTANHAVALVGWNDADGGYWILRNSWGTGWGEGGYMRIRYTSAVVSCEACYFYMETGPTITTLAASNLGDNTARLHGTVNPNNQYTQYYFQYGLSTAYGNNTPTQSAGSGSTEVSVQADLTGLEPRTLYHFRLLGVSGGRSIPGADRTFTTTGAAVPPDVVSLPATGISHEYATLNATVNPRGAATTAWFEYGTNAAYGRVTSKTALGSGSTAVSANRAITGLLPET